MSLTNLLRLFGTLAERSELRGIDERFCKGLSEKGRTGVITIHKGTAPMGLVHDGEEHAKELCAAYDADPELYRSGKQTMAIRRSIYASPAVRAELERAITASVAIAETVIPKPYAYSHVEHWRPK